MQRLRMIETALMDSEMERELPEGEVPASPAIRSPSPSAVWSMNHEPFRTVLVPQAFVPVFRRH